MPWPNLAAYVYDHPHVQTILCDLTVPSAEAAHAVNDDAAACGDNFSTSERSVRRWRADLNDDDILARPQALVQAEAVAPRILVWDIETSPNLAYVWSLWNTNVQPGSIQIPSEVICFAAKWLGEDKVIFRSVFHHGREAMLGAAHRLLSEADAVISYNGKRFDTPVMNRDLLKAGFPPPAPYRHIDLDLTTKSVFKFPSHSLNYVAKELDLGQKAQHEGFALWLSCIVEQDPKAWDRMRRYNIQDVHLTEALYWRIRPWIKDHPFFPEPGDGEARCPVPTCRSTDVKREGFAYTQVSKFQRYSCNDCGKWFRSATREKDSVASMTSITGG